jgi:hypothetical protein
MTTRTRKLVGMIALLAYMIVYSLAVMVFASHYVLPLHWLVQTVCFVVGGIAWLPPAMWLIRWMQRPHPEQAV